MNILHCFTCSSITEEAHSILQMCYEFQGQIQNGSDEILIFINEMENCCPVISGAGVCNINKDIFTSLMTSIVTYFIATVQFDKAFIDKGLSGSNKTCS